MTRSAISVLRRSSPLLVLPIVVGGCSTATYGTGEMPEVAMFREMSGGLLNKNQPTKQIDYQPRAPLVMPASEDQLPPPADTAAAATPDWPVDRDQLKAEADARVADGDPKNDINPAEYRRLKPLIGAFPEQQQTDESYRVGRGSGKDDYYKTIVHGREQRQEFAKAVADAKGIGRDHREFLTDPPDTYRQPVAGADGTIDTASAEPPKGNFITRWWRRHN